MALYKTLFIAATLAFASLASFAPAASAQGATILVVDNARVIRDSAGGKDMSAKINAIGQTMQNELAGEASALDAERQSLETRTQNMTREAVAADPQLRTQAEAFAGKAQAFQVKRQRASQELSQTEQAALNNFGVALDPILQQIVDERGADLLLERSVVAYASSSVDVTDLVIQRLDASVPTINVTRVRLPDQQEAPATIQ